MPLRSQLLSPNARLNACEVQDAAHVARGDRGEHVRLVQEALRRVDGAAVDPGEARDGRYGASTAAAVLRYKTARGIVNRAYQTSPDDIVGKMTVRRLDDDLLALEAGECTPLGGGGMRPWRKRLS